MFLTQMPNCRPVMWISRQGFRLVSEIARQGHHRWRCGEHRSRRVTCGSSSGLNFVCVCARAPVGAARHWVLAAKGFTSSSSDTVRTNSFSKVGGDLWGLSLAVSIYCNYIFSEITTTENWDVPVCPLCTWEILYTWKVCAFLSRCC